MWVCDGKLIGVPTAGASVPNPSGQPSAGNIGLGFAIPVDLAKSVSDQLIATGSVTHSSFGVEAVTVSSAAAGEAGVDQGLYLSRVLPGGPAASAGLRAGDVITKLDDQPATDTNQLAAITLTKRPGDSVSITYERGGAVRHHHRDTRRPTLARQGALSRNDTAMRGSHPWSRRALCGCRLPTQLDADLSRVVARKHSCWSVETSFRVTSSTPGWKPANAGRMLPWSATSPWRCSPSWCCNSSASTLPSPSPGRKSAGGSPSPLQGQPPPPPSTPALLTSAPPRSPLKGSWVSVDGSWGPSALCAVGCDG